MDFNKVINDMKELQDKITSYENKDKKIQDAITSINKDIIKLEKKKEKETDEIEKTLLYLKLLIMKAVINRFEVDYAK